MGRRSRTRTRTTGLAPAPAPARPRRRERALERLPAARRVLAGYLAAALVVGVVALVGIMLLGGAGPLLVLAFAVAGAGLATVWTQRRLAGLELTDDDRLLRLTAGGVLALAVALAAVSAALTALR